MHALSRLRETASLTVRIVDRAESEYLNTTYRGVLGKQGPTNVLAFPLEMPDAEGASNYLGDVVICAPVVTDEARRQGKRRTDHWAHMVIHGILHLAGYDHEGEREAAVMESYERELLGELGIPDPYGEGV